LAVLELLQDGFIRHAILAAFLAGVACSCVGVLVVTMRISFIGVCMSHAAFAGALLGIILGLNPTVVALIFTLLAAAALGPLADRGNFSPDTSLGIIFSSTLGIAFLLLSLVPGPKTEALGLLWGNILTVGKMDIIILAAVMLAIIVLLRLFFKEVQTVVFNREMALASGIPATAVFYGILICSGLTTVASLNAIGGLLVFSLIINPAAAAYQIAPDLRSMFFISALFGVLSGWGGLWLSCLLNLPSGALIILCSTLLFLGAVTFSPKKRPWLADAMSREPRSEICQTGDRNPEADLHDEPETDSRQPCSKSALMEE
jgi:manganese/iron transport system permease protein